MRSRHTLQIKGQTLPTLMTPLASSLMTVIRLVELWFWPIMAPKTSEVLSTQLSLRSQPQDRARNVEVSLLFSCGGRHRYWRKVESTSRNGYRREIPFRKKSDVWPLHDKKTIVAISSPSTCIQICCIFVGGRMLLFFYGARISPFNQLGFSFDSFDSRMQNKNNQDTKQKQAKE